MTPARFVELHAGAEYRAYMYGFAPGWCYLGGLPSELALPRRATPRAPTPPGAVLIGGGLALVASNPMPTGWYVVGRTPERLFSPSREPPLFISPGDFLRFEPVDLESFRALEARAAKGERLALREGGVMNARLRILSAGPGVTLQDEGRRGFLRYGVTPAGPMDADAFLAATRAAGAGAAIEVSLGGVEIAAEEGRSVLRSAPGISRSVSTDAACRAPAR